MRTEIKAIETEYRGYRFRSRLEARWAVYFDVIGLSYEYELEGFDLGNDGLYLPDFWLPGVQSWAEVKPVYPSGNELSRCVALVHMTEKPCALLVGSPEARPYDLLSWMVGAERHERDGGCCHCDGQLCETWPSRVFLCDAKIDPEYVSEQRWFVCCGGGEFEDHRDIERAVQASRAARFEFGESGATRSAPPVWAAPMFRTVDVPEL